MNKLFFLFLMTSSFAQADLLTTIAPEYQANVAYQQQNFAAAQSGYVRSLEQCPDDAVANYNVGTALYKQKKFEQAKAHFERAVKNSSGNNVLLEQSLFNQGNSFVQMGEYEHAIESYEKALEIDQDNERTQKNLALARELLEEQKRKEEEQKKEDQQKDKQKDDQKKDDKQDQDKQKDKNGKEDKDDSSKQDKSDGSDQKDSDQKGKNDKNQDGQKQNSEQNNSEQLDSGNDKKDQSQDKQDDSKKNGDKQQDIDKGKQGEEPKQDQSLQKSKEQEQKPAKKIDGKEEEQGSDNGAQEQDVAEQKEAALQDQYAAQMNADSASDDRLNKKEVMLMKALSDHENSIQKKLLQMNVAKEGGKHEKNW